MAPGRRLEVRRGPLGCARTPRSSAVASSATASSCAVYVFVAATASSGPVARSIACSAAAGEVRARVVRDGDRRRALPPRGRDDADDVRRPTGLRDADHERAVEPGLDAVDRDGATARRGATGSRSRVPEHVLGVDRGMVARAAGGDDDVVDAAVVAAAARSGPRSPRSPSGPARAGALRRRAAPRSRRRGSRDAHGAEAVAGRVQARHGGREPARERGRPGERVREGVQRRREDPVCRDVASRRRVRGEVERRPERDGRRSAGSRPRTASTSAAWAGSRSAAVVPTTIASWSRTASRSAPTSAADGAWATTNSSTCPNRDRRAAARPGATEDEVSAGVWSVGAGWIAAIRAPGARRSGSRPSSSRTSVIDRAASSAARARCSGLPTTARSGWSKPASHARRASTRSADRAAAPTSNSPRARRVPQPRLDPFAGLGIGRRQQQVDARPERGEDVEDLVRTLRQRPHVERVGDRDALEAEPLPEQRRHDRGGERRRQVGVAGEPRDREMGGHHDARPGVDARPGTARAPWPRGRRRPRRSPAARGASPRRRRRGPGSA